MSGEEESRFDPYRTPRGIEPQATGGFAAAREQRTIWSWLFAFLSLLIGLSVFIVFLGFFAHCVVLNKFNVWVVVILTFLLAGSILQFIAASRSIFSPQRPKFIWNVIGILLAFIACMVMPATS